jgi:hypothetical protein
MSSRCLAWPWDGTPAAFGRDAARVCAVAGKAGARLGRYRLEQ